MLKVYIVASFVIAVSSLFLGIFVYLRDRKNLVNFTYFLLSISIAIWSFGFMMTITAPNKIMGLFWIRFLNIGAILIPVFFLHFVLTLLKLSRQKIRILWLAYLINFIILIINFTDLYTRDVTPKLIFKYYAIPGILYPLYVLMLFTYIGYAYYELLKGYKRSTGLKRNQIKYVLVASTIGFSGAITIFFPVFNINIYPFGYLFVFLNSVVITYAIVKHRLMDINFVFKKGVVYAYASLLLLIPIFLLFIYGQWVSFETVNYPFSFFMLCAIVTAAYFFPRVKVKAEKTVEQVIFKNKYDYRKTISDLSRAMVTILNINDLCKEIITTTTEAMRVEKASIYILDEEKCFYELCESMGFGEERIIAQYPKEDTFYKWAEEYREIFIREELERYAADPEVHAVIERMNQMESEVCIPLITKQKLIGVINLGMKSGGGMYTHEDLDLLATLANHATTAVENARLYEDISRAKVQMQRADRLASLGTLTAGLAHEIRNPLVAIKTFTQLLPDRFDDDEFRDHFLNVTAGEVDRISSLVNELLEFARPSQPNLNKEDLNQIIEKMLLLVASASHKKNLEIVKDFHQSLPQVVLDKEQMKQVFLNILLNAIDATPENGTITVGTKLVKKNGYEDAVQIMVRDTGKGIPKEDLEKIFTPFFTTKHQGNGLGLAISHQIVQEHHGHIEVESEESKGTTFSVILFVNPLLTKKEIQWRQ